MTSNETDFPADVRTLILSPEDYLAGGIKVLRFHLTNSDPQTALYVKLTCEAAWLSVTPQEAALAPGENQPAAKPDEPAATPAPGAEKPETPPVPKPSGAAPGQLHP